MFGAASSVQFAPLVLRSFGIGIEQMLTRTGKIWPEDQGAKHLSFSTRDYPLVAADVNRLLAGWQMSASDPSISKSTKATVAIESSFPLASFR